MDNKVSAGGISFGGLLTVVFIALKLMEVITWSWIWILSPLWIPIILVLVIGFIVFIAGFILVMIESIKEDK